MLHRTIVACALGMLLVPAFGACGGAETAPSEIEPTGPPVVRASVVDRHAAQFDEELADRNAGSQEEQAASQYVLGHLQQAGYFVQLDAVPVANLVESTNLVALPPNGEAPDSVVAVGYDGDEDTLSGDTVGVFLELARALYAADPGHRVEFVALGAEITDEHLGSRRLAQQLRDEARDLDVITLIPGADRFGAVGSLADDVGSAARRNGIEPGELDATGTVDVFARAGFDSALVGGPPADLGAALLAYLQDDGG